MSVMCARPEYISICVCEIAAEVYMQLLRCLISVSALLRLHVPGARKRVPLMTNS